jgi:type VI protein secretion system component Hcp
MHTSTHATIRKTAVAFILALLSLSAFLYMSLRERSSSRQPLADMGILTAAAASDATGTPVYKMFLRVDTIQGESDTEKHRTEINVDSFAWFETRNRAATKPTMDSFRLTMPVSKASPQLFLYVAGGIQIPKAVLSVRRSDMNEDFLKWTLTDVQPVSYKTVGNTHGDGIQDELILSFAKAEVEYRQPLPDGSLGPTVKTGWDLRTGKSVP